MGRKTLKTLFLDLLDSSVSQSSSELSESLLFVDSSAYSRALALLSMLAGWWACAQTLVANGSQPSEYEATESTVWPSVVNSALNPAWTLPALIYKVIEYELNAVSSILFISHLSIFKPLNEIFESIIAVQVIVAQIKNFQFLHRWEMRMTSMNNIIIWYIQ